MLRKDFKKLLSLRKLEHKLHKQLSDLGISVEPYDKLVNDLSSFINELIFPPDIIELIEWWLYDNVKKAIYFDKEEYSVETPDQLYDYLVTYNNLKKIKIRKN